MEEPITRRNERIRNHRTDKVPTIVGCGHLTLKNTRFRAPASSTKQTACNSHAAITKRTNTCHYFPQSPLRPHFPQSPSFVTTLRHHPSSSPFVITLPHHFPPSSPFTITHHFPPSQTLRQMYCCVMYCHHFITLRQMYCCVIYCYVMYCLYFTTPSSDVLLCDVFTWCIVTTSPPFVRCIVVWCRATRKKSSVTRKIDSQLPLIWLSFPFLSIVWVEALLELLYSVSVL